MATRLPYRVDWTITIDRPDLRGPSFPDVPPGTRVVYHETIRDRKRAIRFFEGLVRGELDSAGEYVARAQVTQTKPGGGYRWVRKMVERRRSRTPAPKPRPLPLPPPKPAPSPEPPAKPPPEPEARLEYVDLATGIERPADQPGTAATGRVVADIEGQTVPVDREDLIGWGEPRDPRRRRYKVDLEGPVDYRARARAKARSKPRKAKPIRRPRVPGLRSTFSSTTAAAREFYDANEQFFDHVRDPIDGLRAWADAIDVRTGRGKSRKLAKTAAGRKIFEARQGEPQIKAALRWVFAQTDGRRWDRVPWHEIDRLEALLRPYWERPARGGTPGITWKPRAGATDPETLERLTPAVRQRVRDYESHLELKEALESLRATYRRVSRCIPAELRRTALHRISVWSRWEKDPTRIPAYACEPDPATGGQLCRYPAVAGELRRLEQACARAYDPDWAAEEARDGAPGFPDTSAGEPDPAPPVPARPRAPAARPARAPPTKAVRMAPAKPRAIPAAPPTQPAVAAPTAAAPAKVRKLAKPPEPARAPEPKPTKRRASVKECASMLGKRGAEARRKKREMSEADKRKILDDALAVALS